jgi:hypothetical protein
MSPDETRRLLAVASNLKVRTLLSLGYGCACAPARWRDEIDRRRPVVQPPLRGAGNTVTSEQYQRLVDEVQTYFTRQANPAILEPSCDDPQEPRVSFTSSRPALELDDSPALLPVPPELAALTMEPPAPLDRVAIAVAVLGAMDSVQIREVLVRLDDRCIAVIRAVDRGAA